MKKYFLAVSTLFLLAACDYSNKSNGNINEAFADDSQVEVPVAEHHEEEVHTAPAAVLPSDSLKTDSSKVVEESKPQETSH